LPDEEVRDGDQESEATGADSAGKLAADDPGPIDLGGLMKEITRPATRQRRQHLGLSKTGDDPESVK
jgi:hypothetical protein